MAVPLVAAGELARYAAEGARRAELSGQPVSLVALEAIARLAAEGRAARATRARFG